MGRANPTTQPYWLDPMTHPSWNDWEAQTSWVARWSRGLTAHFSRLCHQVRQYGPVQPV